MKDRYLFSVSLLLVLMQTTVLHLLEIGGVMPNFVLLWLIIAIVLFGRFDGIKVALYTGLMSDILMGKGLGTYLLLYLTIAFIIASLEEKIFKDNYITPVVLITSSTVLFHVLFFIIHYFAHGDVNIIHVVLRIIIPEILLNLVIGVVAYTQAFRLYMGYHMR